MLANGRCGLLAPVAIGASVTAVSNAAREAARVFLDQLAQRCKPFARLKVQRPLVWPLHRAPQVAEASFDRRIERCLQGVKIESDALERRFGVEPVAICPQHLMDGRFPILVNHVLDEHRRLEVRHRDGLGPREPPVQVPKRQDCLLVEV